jgi:tRNA threonylcarbamoyladenosine biosynthesis protein TsaB
LFENSNRLCEDKAVLIEELGEELKQYNKKIVFICDGAKICYEKLSSVIDNIEVAEENIRFVHASSIGRLANKKINSGEPLVKSKSLVPFYLRLPQAERELNNKNSLKKENIK